MSDTIQSGPDRRRKLNAELGDHAEEGWRDRPLNLHQRTRIRFAMDAASSIHSWCARGRDYSDATGEFGEATREMTLALAHMQAAYDALANAEQYPSTALPSEARGPQTRGKGFEIPGLGRVRTGDTLRVSDAGRNDTKPGGAGYLLSQGMVSEDDLNTVTVASVSKAQVVVQIGPLAMILDAAAASTKLERVA